MADLDQASRCLRTKPVPGDGIGVFTTQTFEAGETIILLGGHITSNPTRYSVQLGPDRHLDRSSGIDDEIRHSCEPSAKIEFDPVRVVALRHIDPDEEVTLDYCASELSLIEPFWCNCGAPHCYGRIAGFECLTPEQKLKVLRRATPFVRTVSTRLDEKDGRGTRPS